MPAGNTVVTPDLQDDRSGKINMCTVYVDQEYILYQEMIIIYLYQRRRIDISFDISEGEKDRL